MRTIGGRRASVAAVRRCERPGQSSAGARGGVTEGIAIFQHPGNRWYPSKWFTRDYGFFSPTPMTPGRLSEASPISAMMSNTPTGFPLIDGSAFIPFGGNIESMLLIA